jgi:hypothetical protein
MGQKTRYATDDRHGNVSVQRLVGATIYSTERQLRVLTARDLAEARLYESEDEALQTILDLASERTHHEYWGQRPL